MRVLLRGHWVPRRAEVVGEDDPAVLARAPARFAAARPSFIDLGRPPAQGYSPEQLLRVVCGHAVITMTLPVG